MGCAQSSADPHANQQQGQTQNQQTVQPQLQQQSQPQYQQQQIQQVKPQKQKQVNDTKKQWPLDPNNFNKLPEAIKDRYKKAKEKGSFEDLEFPRKESSLGGPEYKAQIQPFLATLAWKKPAQFIEGGKFVLFDGIEPGDIVQGQLGVCYCLATVSVYASDPEKVVDIFPFYDLKLGFYVLRFYTHGKPNYVVIDDYFPCDSNENVPLFTKPMGNQIWVLLIEKAWAKIIGSYFSAESMSADFFMEDLTGCPSYGVWFKDKENNVDEVVTASYAGYLVVLTSSSKQMEGIVNDHAYSLLQVFEHNQALIFKIRNPWGAFQWNGQYGEQSPLWTPELRQKCGQQKGDDGIFFLSHNQLVTIFEYYSIGIDESNSKYSFVEFKSQPEESVYFKFKLAKKGNMAIRVSQPFDRIVKDKQYKYSPVVFEVGKIENQQVAFYSQGGNQCLYGQKSVYSTDEVYNEYEPGEYFIKIKMQWVDPKKYNTAVLSVYCQQNVTFERIKQPEGLKLWRSFIASYMHDKELTDLDDNIAYGMQWMKGQMICYTAIREGGNLDNYKIKWTFVPSQFKNCRIGLNKASESTIQYTIDKKEKYDFGTVNRINLSEECEAGTAEVQNV